MRFGLQTAPLFHYQVRPFCFDKDSRRSNHVKELEYVSASRAVGVSGFGILFIHILPNALTPIIVQASLGIASASLDAAALSFLGLGAEPPRPEWGLMLGEVRNSVFNAPFLVFSPALPSC